MGERDRRGGHCGRGDLVAPARAGRQARSWSFFRKLPPTRMLADTSSSRSSSPSRTATSFPRGTTSRAQRTAPSRPMTTGMARGISRARASRRKASRSRTPCTSRRGTRLSLSSRSCSGTCCRCASSTSRNTLSTLWVEEEVGLSDPAGHRANARVPAPELGYLVVAIQDAEGLLPLLEPHMWVIIILFLSNPQTRHLSSSPARPSPSASRPFRAASSPSRQSRSSSSSSCSTSSPGRSSSVRQSTPRPRRNPPPESIVRLRPCSSSRASRACVAAARTSTRFTMSGTRASMPRIWGTATVLMLCAARWRRSLGSVPPALLILLVGELPSAC